MQRSIVVGAYPRTGHYPSYAASSVMRGFYADRLASVKPIYGERDQSRNPEADLWFQKAMAKTVAYIATLPISPTVVPLRQDAAAGSAR